MRGIIGGVYYILIYINILILIYIISFFAFQKTICFSENLLLFQVFVILFYILADYFSFSSIKKLYFTLKR